jgi:hypothetical protein
MAIYSVPIGTRKEFQALIRENFDGTISYSIYNESYQE